MGIGKKLVVVDAALATRLFNEATQRGVAVAADFRSVPRTTEDLKRLSKKCKQTASTLKGAVSAMPKDRQTEAANIVSACETFARVLEELAKGDDRLAKREYNW